MMLIFFMNIIQYKFQMKINLILVLLQYGVVPLDNGFDFTRKYNGSRRANQEEEPTPVKISPWALAHLNAQKVSKAATEARKKSQRLFVSGDFSA